MQGLDICRAFFEEHGRPMLHEQFPDYENRIAVGVSGPGSECYGFDDEISRDHDFFAGFALWLTEEDEEKIGFRLIRAYNRLPDEFMGVKLEAKSCFSVGKFGVKTIPEFLRNSIGSSSVPQRWEEWFYLPEHALAQAVNGEVFVDSLGEFSAIRKTLKYGMPLDVKRKKLAAHCALAAQAGQYNFARCYRHGEALAAQTALFEFTDHALRLMFSLGGEYLPYYKWRFRALKSLDKFSAFLSDFSMLLTTPNNEETFLKKQAVVEKIAAAIAAELQRQNLTHSNSDYLENHALSITSQIESAPIRALHLMDFGE
ncbi:MAG TPA: hypothetical protein DDY98_05700 [Ruminococcaceae bacterium]|nr:hypothetical protein [Oscillospiraceae bacterium]